MNHMYEEILTNLFRIKIPLPESPLRYLNSYVIRNTGRSLIIDTGLNRRECLEAMQSALGTLGVDLKKTDLFITHLHADHFGLVSELATDSSTTYFSRPEKEIIESWEGFEPMIAYAGKNGFPEEELRAAIRQHPGNKFGSDWIPELSLLDDGDQICYGQYRFSCVATPGHTMGHTCLYEPDKNIFIAGDHILIDITPNIQCWSDDQNPLKHYLASLDKVYPLEIDIVLPGHRRLIKNHRARIHELKTHHAKRLEEVLSILSRGPMNSYQVASLMTWDIRSESWDQFPATQKWFATGEAISHLRYLEDNEKVQRKRKDGVTIFSI